MMAYSIKRPLFPLGNILIAPAVESLGIGVPRLLRCHQTGDFGCVTDYDIQQNHHAIGSGGGIISQYPVSVGNDRLLICVMTEGDRSYTVVFILDPSAVSAGTPEGGDTPETGGS